MGGILLAAIVAIGCRESLTAPGTCPEYCPPESVQLVDTLLTQAILGDSTFTGYVAAAEAGGLQLITDPAAGSGLTTSRAVLRFFTFPDSVILNQGDTVLAPVTGIDSLTLTVPVQRRTADVSGVTLALYRLPISIDSAVTFASLDVFFTDSTRIGEIEIPDTLPSGNVVGSLPISAFPDFDVDSSAAIGIAVESADPTHVLLGSLEVNSAALLTRHLQVDSSGASAARSDSRLPALDTYVAPAVTPPAANALQIGGVPAARTLLRFDLPPRILDSVDIVRATIVFVPTEPVLGGPGDSIAILAQPVTADVGPKSPLFAVPLDSLVFRATFLPVGSTDTLLIDVTDILQGWAADPDLPRLIAVRAVPEGGSFAELRVGSTASAGSRPTLHVTFVPPINLGGR